MVVSTLDFVCIDIGFWLGGCWILVVWTLDFDYIDLKNLVVWTFDIGCLDVGYWLIGRWILVRLTLDIGCMDIGFWLFGH